MPSIHSTAVVDSRSQVADDVQVGPFCVIEPGAVIGAGCRLEARAVVKSGVSLGCECHLHEAAVLGGAPQHLQAPKELGELIIGDRNVFRENVTVHRAMEAGRATIIGDDNYLMVNAHVAHDCRIGERTIIANNVMLAGHVEVGDRAFLSGAAGVHQFCRVGALAMVGGQARVTQDVPPYVTVDGKTTSVVGLNRVGIKRAGVAREEIDVLMQAYRLIYRSDLAFAEMLVQLAADFSDGPAALFHQFLSNGRRGFLQERRGPRASTLRLRGDQTSRGDKDLRKAG